MAAQPGARRRDSGENGIRRMESDSGGVARRRFESREKGRQDSSRLARPPRRDEIPAHGNEPAVRAGAGTLPRPAEELRRNAATKGDGIPRAGERIPGPQENHSAQDRAGIVRDHARSRERNAGPHPALAVRPGRRQLCFIREPAGILRRWARRLFVRGTLRDDGQLGPRPRPLWTGSCGLCKARTPPEKPSTPG